MLTELEHHSNYVPWHYLRNLKGVKIKFAEVNDDGEVTVESIEKKITSKTKINCCYSFIKCYWSNFTN